MLQAARAGSNESTVRDIVPPRGRLLPPEDAGLAPRVCRADGTPAHRHGDVSLSLRDSCRADPPDGWSAEYRAHR